MRLYPEQILSCFDRLSLENDFIGPYCNRRTITEIRPNYLLCRRAAVFMTTSELHRVLMHFHSFSFRITKLFSFSDIELLEDSGIPTEAFLASCYAVVPVLGKIKFVLNSLVSRICLTAVILQ